MKIRSLFISDVHLGSEHSDHEKLLEILSNVECDFLYIVGDFIDGWALKRKFRWHKNINVILQKILRMSRKGTKVFYVWGNHDDFMEQFNEINFGENIKIVRECDHTTIKGEKLLIIHGDQFDGIIGDNKWIQKIGAVIYDYSLCANKLFRVFKFSLSNFLKRRAKKAVKYISNYESVLANYCRDNGYDGVICGHIHQAECRKINKTNYYNCGSFIINENSSFLIENLEGEIKLIV